MLGHALVATEDRKNFAEAKAVLKRAVSRDNEDPFAWYQLGIIYDREGDPRPRLARQRRALNLEGKPMMALTSARIALKGIKPGTPDCLRAQDIAMATKAELERRPRTRRWKTTCARQGSDQDSRRPACLHRRMSEMPKRLADPRADRRVVGSLLTVALRYSPCPRDASAAGSCATGCSPIPPF